MSDKEHGNSNASQQIPGQGSEPKSNETTIQSKNNTEQFNNDDFITRVDDVLPGKLLQGNNGVYIIEKRIGEGLTAIVYKGLNRTNNQQVAIKILNKNASHESEEHFWSEGSMLAEFSRVGAAQWIAAKLDEKRTDDLSFLIIEYVGDSYRSLEAIVFEKGPLNESEVLCMLSQSLDLLEKLHTEIERSYTDMKLSNFYWDSSAKKLKVIDWNHVSPKRADIEERLNSASSTVKIDMKEKMKTWWAEDFSGLVRNDLSRLSAYLYFMLTGKSALTNGETLFMLERRAGESWEKISVATRQLLAKGLHPNVNKRFNTEVEYRQVLKNIQDLWAWEKGDQQYHQELRAELEKAKNTSLEHADDISSFGRASVLLDMFARRGLDEDMLERYQKRLYELTHGFPEEWMFGKRFYEANQPITAIQRWSEVAVYQGRLDLWRWVILAHVAAEDLDHFYSVRPIMENALEQLNQDNFSAALNIFQNYQGKTDSLNLLKEEIYSHEKMVRISNLTNSPDSSEWEKAIMLYREIENWLVILEQIDRPGITVSEPQFGWKHYSLLLRNNYGWQNLNTLADNLQTKVAIREKDNTQFTKIREILLTNNIQAIEDFKTIIQFDPGISGLLGFCQDVVKLLPKRNAFIFVELAYVFGNNKEKEGIHLLYKKLFQELANEKKWSDFELFKSELEEAFNQFDWMKVESLAGKVPPGDPNQIKVVQTSVSQKYQQEFKQKNIRAMIALDHLLIALGGFAMHQQEIENLIQERKKNLDEPKLLEKLQQRQKLLEFIESQYAIENDLREMLWSKTPDEYPEIIKKINKKVGEVVIKFSGLDQENEFIAWKKHWESMKLELENKQQNWIKADQTLDQTMEKNLDFIQTCICSLELEKLNLAKENIAQSKRALESPSWQASEMRSECNRHKKTIEDFEKLMRFLEKNDLLSRFIKVQHSADVIQEKIQRLEKGAFNSLEDVKRTYDYMHRQLMDVKKELKLSISPVFSTLIDLGSQISTLEAVQAPFSAAPDSSPGTENTGATQAKVASTTFMDSSKNSFLSRIVGTSSLSIIQALFMAFVMIMLAVIVFQVKQLEFPISPSIPSIATMEPTETITFTVTSTTTPTSTTTATATATETATPLPRSGIDMVFAPELLELPSGSLYDIPPLHLVAEEGWTFQTSDIMEIMAVDPGSVQSKLVVQIYNRGGTGTPLLNITMVSKDVVDAGSTVASWVPPVPDEPVKEWKVPDAVLAPDQGPLPAGDYTLRVELEGSQYAVLNADFSIVSIPFEITNKWAGELDGVRMTLSSPLGKKELAENTALEVIGQTTIPMGGTQGTFFRGRVKGTRHWLWLKTDYVAADDLTGLLEQLPVIKAH